MFTTTANCHFGDFVVQPFYIGTYFNILNLLKAVLQSFLLLKLYFLVFFTNTNKFMNTLIFKLVVSFYVSHFNVWRVISISNVSLYK